MTRISKQEIIDQQREEISALRRNIHDLKQRHDHAIDELAELAQGIGNKPSWYSAVSHGWDIPMKHKASLAIRRIAKMSLREAP